MSDPPVPGGGDAYARGAEAGEIRERLASHDRHFASINGSLAKVATEMHDMTLAVQRLGDQAEAGNRSAAATAQAVRDAQAARLARSAEVWSPWQKTFAVLAAVATAVALFIALRALG